MEAKAKREISGARIRKLGPEEAPAVASILRQAPEAAKWSLQGIGQSASSVDGVALVSEESGAISGFLLARLTADGAEILNMAVLPAARRRGQGGMLLEAALEEFAERGTDRVFLEVRESNEVAIAFYSKNGFSKTGRRPGYYHDPDEAAVLMEKKLTGFTG